MNNRNEYELHSDCKTRTAYHRAHYEATRGDKPIIPTWIKMVALALCIGLAGGISEARADEWTGPDKVKHVAAGALIAAPVSMLTDSWAMGAAAGCAVGIAKELVDMRTPGHTPSYKDAVVTCVGAAVGAKIGVMIAPVRGGVFVGKSWSF